MIAAATSRGRSTAASDTKHAPSAKSACDRARRLEREPRLADAAGPGQRQQTHRAGAEPLATVRTSRARPIVRFGGDGSALRRRDRSPPISASASSAGSWARMAWWTCCSSAPARCRAARPARGGRAGRPQAPPPDARCDRARASASAAKRSRVGCSATNCCSSLTSAACRPAARSASTRASSAASRCSSRRAISTCANGSNSSSASGGPRHSLQRLAQERGPPLRHAPAAARAARPPHHARSAPASSSSGPDSQPVARRRRRDRLGIAQRLAQP